MNDVKFAICRLLKLPAFASVAVLTLTLSIASTKCAAAENRAQGSVSAAVKRPTSFPHRIWAACDFEGRTPDYGWFGRSETNDIPKYPGNHTALVATERPYRNVSAVMAGINPVPGPRMGKENGLF